MLTSRAANLAAGRELAQPSCRTGSDYDTSV